MTPSRLVFLRDVGEQDLVESEPLFGLAETPPDLGHRFILTKVDGTVVKTGIIEAIEWRGKVRDVEYEIHDPRPGRRPRVQKTYAVEGVEDKIECLFYTAHSIYRWKRQQDGE